MDTASLSDAALALISAKNAFAANLQVLHVSNQMQAHTLDLLA